MTALPAGLSVRTACDLFLGCGFVLAILSIAVLLLVIYGGHTVVSKGDIGYWAFGYTVLDLVGKKPPSLHSTLCRCAASPLTRSTHHFTAPCPTALLAH